MNKLEKFFMYGFGVLGIIALIAALFGGATHQIFVAIISGVMYFVLRPGDPEGVESKEDQQIRIKL